MEVQAREEMFVWGENLRCRGRCVRKAAWCNY